MTNTRGKSKVAVPASKKRKGPLATFFSSLTGKARHPFLRFTAGPQENLYQLYRVRPLDLGWFFTIIEPTYSELTLKFGATFSVQQVMSVYDNPGTITFRLGRLVRHMNVSEFGATLGLYKEEFMSVEDFLQLHRHIYHSSSCYWTDLTGSLTNYDTSRSKATRLSPALRYLHALLAHTLTERRESTGGVSTYDAYFLWSMATGHIIDLAYFIALSFRHQTERHKKGPICLGPYVTRLARHFGLLDTPEQSSTLTLVGQLSPQGISSMIHIRMIEQRHGVDPPQYRLF
ncbi:hypothetical protein PVK06_004472 [Gossypium arboreum]|uniref:Uncharacterized protein n=1 Tax=Gossypium arboreum TaxID=29729 RepID=A0ABR0QS44_GOSAR|nr:hypothetical protein PVK06_004472 [Gossypium arboreum]